MRTRLLAAAGSAAFALTLSATAAFAGYAQPGETMGVSLISPLPEGVFFADLEDYGRSDTQGPGTANVGVNIPVIIWATPFTFYNTRLEFIAALPFIHTDGAVNVVEPITYAVGPLFAHDFGNGLTGGLGVLFRSPTPDTFTAQNIDGRTRFAMDFRESLQYVYSGGGPFNGITFIQNAFVTSTLGASNYGPTTASGAGVQNDFFAGDFAIEKTFDKFTIGFTGFGNIDINNLNGNAPLNSSVELGGLIGYDFGKFSLTGIVTRSVYVAGGSLGTSDTVSAGYETRGWVRVIVPLYVAPTAPVVTARY